MSRTTSAAVEALLMNDYDTDARPSLLPFIATANAIVTRVQTCADAKGLSLSTTELELVERWLAAHYYALSDQVYQTHSTNGASATFQGQTGMSLESTKYGQAALNIDYSGCLTAIAKRQFASSAWLGKTIPEQLDYDQRN